MKSLSIILSIIAYCWLVACTNEREQLKYVSAAEQGWRQHKGIMYLHDQAFTGFQFGLYENGDTMFVATYLKGKRNGGHKGWWQNGLPKFVYHLKQDVYEGSVKEWHENGALFRDMHYTEGHESGLQQIRLADGALYANYEVRNGRNYGLTGTMHCKNYWKNER